MSRCSCMFVGMHVEAKNKNKSNNNNNKKPLGAISQSLCILLFWRQGLLLVWGSPIRRGWLATETQGTTCLCLSSSGISSEYQCARLEHQTLCLLSSLSPSILSCSFSHCSFRNVGSISIRSEAFY